MSVLGRFLRLQEGGLTAFFCPACGHMHGIPLAWSKEAADLTAASGGRRPWVLEGGSDGRPHGLDAPTITPSVKVTGKRKLTEDEYVRILAGERVKVPDAVCHLTIGKGQITYCADSTHALAGQIVPMVACDD